MNSISFMKVENKKNYTICLLQLIEVFFHLTQIKLTTLSLMTYF
jgi:hypothetical protein